MAFVPTFWDTIKRIRVGLMRIGRPYAQWAAHWAGREKHICPWAELGGPLQRHKLSGWAGQPEKTWTLRSGGLGCPFLDGLHLCCSGVMFSDFVLELLTAIQSTFEVNLIKSYFQGLIQNWEI